MGNFSKDPNTRATDAMAKQYVGVRLQQAVPLLDADWNLLEDLRRVELESVGKLFIGSGVPPGSDGFGVFASGQPNDFGIRAGLCLAGGKLVRNDTPCRYTTQPNFGNPNLTPPLPNLQAPNANKSFIVYLDVWEREVDSQEDLTLVDARIGVETSVRLKRDWAVRVASVPEDLPMLDTPPAGHAFLRLARLNRAGGDTSITTAMIADLRDTQLSVQRKVEVRDNGGNVIVDNQRFRHMLEITRTNILAFVRYITTQFNAAFSGLVSAEILGVQAAIHIAHTAEAGIAQTNALTLANRGALDFMRQMYDAESYFLSVWHDHVLTLGGSVKKYASYKAFVANLDARLNQPAVGHLTGLLPALTAGNLGAATEMQEEIARLIGAAGAAIARGSIQVSYTNAPPGNLVLGQIARFEFRVRSFTTLADTYTVSILPLAGWPRVLVDGSSNPVPDNKVPIGPSGAELTLFVNVTVQAGSTQLQLHVVSNSNPSEIDQFTGIVNLTQGLPAPLGEDKIQFHLENPDQVTIDPATGVLNIARNKVGAIGVRVFNNTGQQATLDLSVEVVPNTQVGTWTIIRSGDPSVPLPDKGNARAGGIKVTTAGDSVSVQVKYIASTTIAGAPVKAEIVTSWAAS